MTADHVIEPIDLFRSIIASGLELAQRSPCTLVTFGITPTYAATGYGYLELGPPVEEGDCPNFRSTKMGPGAPRVPSDLPAESAPGPARIVERFQEKPDEATAETFVAAGPERYLWNSGMFVWRAATLLECIRRFAPAAHASLLQIAAAWDGPDRQAVLDEVYPQLTKISVDYAVMEPASRDADFQAAAIPMPLAWRDVGSWNALAEISSA